MGRPCPGDFSIEIFPFFSRDWSNWGWDTPLAVEAEARSRAAEAEYV